MINYSDLIKYKEYYHIIDSDKFNNIHLCDWAIDMVADHNLEIIKINEYYSRLCPENEAREVAANLACTINNLEKIISDLLKSHPMFVALNQSGINNKGLADIDKNSVSILDKVSFISVAMESAATLLEHDYCVMKNIAISDPALYAKLHKLRKTTLDHKLTGGDYCNNLLPSVLSNYLGPKLEHEKWNKYINNNYKLID